MCRDLQAELGLLKDECTSTRDLLLSNPPISGFSTEKSPTLSEIFCFGAIIDRHNTDLDQNEKSGDYVYANQLLAAVQWVNNHPIAPLDVDVSVSSGRLLRHNEKKADHKDSNDDHKNTKSHPFNHMLAGNDVSSDQKEQCNQGMYKFVFLYEYM